MGIAELVENGARSAYDLVTAELGHERQGKIVVLAGPGFTGAVAFALARHLANHRYTLTVIHLFGSQRQENRRQRETLVLSGATVSERLEDLGEDVALVVDALVAREGAPADDATLRAAMASMARCRKDGARIISLEMPTGVDPVTGVPMDGAVRADATLCMAFPRTGLTTEWCGRLFVGDIGIPPEMYRRYALVAHPCVFRDGFTFQVKPLSD